MFIFEISCMRMSIDGDCQGLTVRLGGSIRLEPLNCGARAGNGSKSCDGKYVRGNIPTFLDQTWYRGP